MNIISANGHPEAFQMVETGRAVAFVMDDILLAGLVANSRNPGEFELSKDFLSLEPYGAMLRKDDPAFQKLADDATAALYKSPQMTALYDKWFMKPIPPKGVNLNVPMSAELKKTLANPTHNGDPKAYQ
jgi:glutamate/aspartate transport system substrate-binding protein